MMVNELSLTREAVTRIIKLTSTDEEVKSLPLHLRMTKDLTVYEKEGGNLGSLPARVINRKNLNTNIHLGCMTSQMIN